MDRLDYTKGLVARMRALQRLFEKYPKWIGKVQLIQVAVPSRTDVVEYKVSSLPSNVLFQIYISFVALVTLVAQRSDKEYCYLIAFPLLN